jgi:hypothetical protein
MRLLQWIIGCGGRVAEAAEDGAARCHLGQVRGIGYLKDDDLKDDNL